MYKSFMGNRKHQNNINTSRNLGGSTDFRRCQNESRKMLIFSQKITFEKNRQRLDTEQLKLMYQTVPSLVIKINSPTQFVEPELKCKNWASFKSCHNLLGDPPFLILIPLTMF